MYIAVTVIAAMLLGAGFVLQQHAAAKLPASYLHLRLIAELLRQRIWLGGITVMVVGQALSAWGLGHLSLTVSEPLLATNLIFALLLAAPISGEIPRRTEFAGAILLCLGVGALSASRSVRALSESFGSSSHWPAAAVIAGIAAAMAIGGRNGPARMRATLTGAGGGLLLGVADALTRRSVELIDGHGLAPLLSTWPGYAVICTAAVGLWLVQSAFSAGPLHASLPAVTAAEPLAGITLGVLVFGDVVHVTPWLLALQAAGLAAMVGGTILVARAPTFVKLSLRPADHGLPKLRVSVGPPADDEVARPAEHPAALSQVIADDPGAADGQDAMSSPLGTGSPAGTDLIGSANPASPDTTASAILPPDGDPAFPGLLGRAVRSRGSRAPAARRSVAPALGIRRPAFPAAKFQPSGAEGLDPRDASPWQIALATLRNAWLRLAGLVVPRLRVSKVPQPPAAQ
jgi:drug/metabolite transporter (DMT)-like permease